MNCQSHCARQQRQLQVHTLQCTVPCLGSPGPNITPVLLGWNAKQGQEGTGHSAAQHTELKKMPKHIEEWRWMARESYGGNQAELNSKNTTCVPGKLSMQHLRGREAHPTVDRGGYVNGLSRKWDQNQPQNCAGCLPPPGSYKSMKPDVIYQRMLKRLAYVITKPLSMTFWVVLGIQRGSLMTGSWQMLSWFSRQARRSPETPGCQSQFSVW